MGCGASQAEYSYFNTAVLMMDLSKFQLSIAEGRKNKTANMTQR